MTRVGIVSLIYKSPDYADFVYNGIMDQTGRNTSFSWDFIFIVNPPYTQEIIDHIANKEYPAVVLPESDSECDKLPHPRRTTPDYMAGVYRGWNRAIEEGEKRNYDYLVLINSDMYFCNDWLEPLVVMAETDVAATSLLVESGKLASLPGLISRDFGRSLTSFRKEEFLAFAESIKKPGGKMIGGGYMPLCMKMKHFVQKYPLGNFNNISGDALFFQYLHFKRIQHFTALDSIAYHIQEGEKDDGREGNMGWRKRIPFRKSS